MQPLATQSNNHLFRDAEHLWFWFIQSRKVRSGFYRPGNTSGRPCELVDVETLITKLYLSGKLTDQQLAVMKEFGERRCTPCQHIYSQNTAAALWNSAMKTIHAACLARGWIESN